MSAKTLSRSGGGKNTAKPARVVFLDYLRAFAPLAVIGIHVCTRSPLSGKDIPTDYYSWSYVVLVSMTRLCRLAVPVFCMISGALFLNPRRKFDWKKHFGKVIPRIILIYVVWSLLYALLVALTISKSSDEFWVEFISKSLSGCWHLWYLKLVIAAYLLVPLFRKITESRRLLEHTMKLIVFGLSIVTLGRIFEVIAQRFPGNLVFDAVRNAMNSSVVNVVGFYLMGFFIYFFVGYYLSSRRFKKKERYLIYLLGVFGFIMTVVFSVAQTRVGGDYDYGVLNDAYGDIGMFFYASAVFLWVREVVRRRKTTPRLVAFMAKHSLGVYILHAAPLILICRFYIIPVWHLWSMLVVIPGSVLIVYVVSLLLSCLLSKIPLVKKVV